MRVLVKINHDGRKFLAGKTCVARGNLVFYHQSERECWNHTLNSPYGVDAGLLRWLEEMRIEYFHHFIRSENKLYITSVADIAQFGIYQEDEDRLKVFLPAVRWERFDGRGYHVPWIEDEIIVNAISAWQKECAAR